MIPRLVGAAQYRGMVGVNFVELRRGDLIEVTEEQAEGLLEFPGWFEVVDPTPLPPSLQEGGTAGERQARPRRDRMVRGGNNRNGGDDGGR